MAGHPGREKDAASLLTWSATTPLTDEQARVCNALAELPPRDQLQVILRLSFGYRFDTSTLEGEL